MHFYPHNISDFNNSTRHLTRVERSVYREAIERYYDTECELTLDFGSLSKRLLCATEEEKEALRLILSEFFTKTEIGYFHERCDEEIIKYRANTSAKAKAGIASAAARKKKATESNRCSTGAQQSDNEIQLNNKQETINNKQEIKEKDKKKTPLKIIKTVDQFFNGVSEKVRNDFIAHRKNKKALITETAINGIDREAEKAGISLEAALIECCSRGWVGFKAEWYLKTPARGSPSSSPQGREEFNRQQTEIAKQKLFGNQSQEKDITNEATTL